MGIADVGTSQPGDEVAAGVGRALRDARRAAGMSLQDVAARSGGRFRPSTIGCYERGERALTISRLCELAAFYGVAAEQLLATALGTGRPAGQVMIDLHRLSEIPSEVARRLASYCEQIARQRAQRPEGTVTLRGDDIGIVARASELDPAQLLERLEPVLIR